MPRGTRLKCDARCKKQAEALLHECRCAGNPCDLIVSVPGCLYVDANPIEVGEYLAKALWVAPARVQTYFKAHGTCVSGSVYDGLLGKGLPAREDHAIQQSATLLQEGKEVGVGLLRRREGLQKVVLAVGAAPGATGQKSDAGKLSRPVDRRERGDAPYEEGTPIACAAVGVPLTNWHMTYGLVAAQAGLYELDALVELALLARVVEGDGTVVTHYARPDLAGLTLAVGELDAVDDDAGACKLALVDHGCFSLV